MTPALAGAARSLFNAEIGGAAGSADIAAGVERACHKLDRHLARVVGADGMRALFHRTIALGAGEPAGLSLPGATPAQPWDRFCRLLAARPRAEAIENAANFIAVLIGMIARYIGGSLTLQLLEELWPATQTANNETS